MVGYKGWLVPIKELIDLVERRPTPHPCIVIDLTGDDEDDGVPDSEGGSVRDFVGEEKEQAANEEEEMLHAKSNRAAADPAPEYLPSYQDPPGIDDPFVSE